MPAVQRARGGQRPRRRCGPVRSATATSTSSTGRRSGRRPRTWPKFGILIARTDPDAPKHKGISYFICPMDAPGIEIRPIVEMTGAHMFNQVFFTDVRIPAANLVGDENEGWTLAKVTLGNERVSLSSGGALWGMGPTAEDLLDVVREAGGVDDPVARQRLAQLHIEAKVLDLIRLRTVSAAHPRRAARARRRRSARCSPTSTASTSWQLARDLAGAGRDAGVGRSARHGGRALVLRLPVQPRADDRRRHRRGAALDHRRTRARPSARAALD